MRLAAILALSLGTFSPAQEVATVGGTVPDFTFPALLHGDGRQKLSEFAGQPVLIEFWGTR